MTLSHDIIKFSRQDLERSRDVDADTHFEKYKGKKIIFLARDPRDTVISYYFEISKRQKVYQGRKLFEGNLSEFIRNPHFGIVRIVNFLNSWVENKHMVQDFLIVKYEDLHKDADSEIRRLLEFMGVADVKHDYIGKSIDFASFKKMKKMEKSNALKTSLLKPTDKNDEDSYKIRKGKVGGYKEYLNQEDMEYINQQLKKLNPLFGYC